MPRFLAGIVLGSVIMALLFLFAEEPPTMQGLRHGLISMLATEPAESLCEKGARLNCEDWNEDWLWPSEKSCYAASLLECAGGS